MKWFDQTRPHLVGRLTTQTTAAIGRRLAAASDSWNADVDASALARVSDAEGQKTNRCLTFRCRWGGGWG